MNASDPASEPPPESFSPEVLDHVERVLRRWVYPQRKELTTLVDSGTFGPEDLGAMLARLAEAASMTLDVERTSVWRLRQDGSAIDCLHLFERGPARHSQGLVISEQAAPEYFRALASERVIAAHLAREDPRTAEFREGYLEPLGITSMLDAPVFVDGKATAVICHEHVGAPRRWQFWEELVASTFADFVALLLSAEARRRQALERRAYEAELERLVRERTEALSESERTLKALLDSGPIPLILSRTDDHRVVYANAKALKLFEVDADQLPSVDTVEFWADPTERQRFLSEVLAKGSVDDLEVQLRTKRDRTFWAHMNATAMRIGGELTFVVGIIDISAQKDLEQRLRLLATVDELTLAYNRRHFFELGARELERAARYSLQTSLAMIDIDHFKDINDELGHAAGDVVLRALVEAMKKQVRSIDVIGRIGSEEFAILLPETPLEPAKVMAERIRSAIAGTSFDEAGLPGPRRITVSIGVAPYQPGETLSDLLKHADEALYRAKHAGRDRVIVWDEGPKAQPGCADPG